jgi:putative flippase GtrA
MSVSHQVPRFLTVGVINTLVDIAIFAALTGAGLAPVPANVVSYGCGIVSSYLLNSAWTFRGDGGARLSWTRFGGTAAASLSVLGLSTLIVGLLSATLTPLGAKIVATAVTTAINFLVLRRLLGGPPPRR